MWVFFLPEQRLSNYDRDICRAFAYKLKTHTTDEAFTFIPRAFETVRPLPSLDAIRARVKFLAGFKPQQIHCCVNSCCAFTAQHENLQQCPYCGSNRLKANGRPQKVFTYIPLIPRLIALASNSQTAEAMTYRANHRPGTTSSAKTDIFDGSHYQSLRHKDVILDDVNRGHQFFSDNRDIALGLSTDGFAPFKRRKNTAWPLILFNYNLPPDKRFHIEQILALGVIPGPKKPHDIDSFLWPAILEFLELAKGVRAFDALSLSIFLLRAYLIAVFGDIPAVSLLMHMKGHNGIVPCRFCEIRGLRIPDTRITTHYVPLNRSSHPAVRADPSLVAVYDPQNLPLRTHNRLLAQGTAVQQAPTTAEAERLAKKYGIKGVPALSFLPSLDFPGSFPYDFMHLIWENLIKNLILLWTGDFKGLDEGTESYVLASSVWESIGAATATSGQSIPSAYGARVPNVQADRSNISAEMWSIWTLYIGPVLLRRRFTKPKYFRHFSRLVRLLHTCLQFEITPTEIDDLELGFQKWVRDFEEIYYQYNPSRIAACPLTVHALLHIASGIRTMGPVWCYWAFPMERYCGKLQWAIRSRRFPYPSLDRFVTEDAQLTQIQAMYNLFDELSLKRSRKDCPGSMRDDAYPSFLFLPPSRRLDEPDPTIIRNISAALVTRALDVNEAHSPLQRRRISIATVKKLVGEACVIKWGKVRQIDSEEGDTIHASSMRTLSTDLRDASFVRYQMYIDKNASAKRRKPVYELKTFYGQLEAIYSVQFSDAAAIELLQLDHDLVVLVAIRVCKLLNSQPVDLERLDIHLYSEMGSLDVVDITTVQALVGRVKDDNNTWGLVDRSGSLSRAIGEDEDED
ncbi:hypothetical protein D9619_007521 [Psilocybe cf. subviscida]|uniref:Transposase family Tnp2 protein n=1 Tax=Psilocybe cf. subviscida TaxID=2480587 RepID=A0A8H5B2X1_9AGAR|nr:hypothetical protein D9619_007521 [Psilocybe cf. subviscida]